jgi:uncharacterized protein
MLIEFTVGNFRSFKEPVTLSLVAARLSSQDPQIDINNTFQVEGGLKLLTTAAVYGANASGKSNLVRALVFMKDRVLNSSRESQANELIETEPFRLDAATEKQPSYFEIIFLHENIPYRYGFEVTHQKVVSEWLFYSPHGKEAELFIREDDNIQSKRAFKGARPLVANKSTRPNALFLSVAAQFNVEIANKVTGWFRAVGLVSGLDDLGYGGFTVSKYMEDELYRAEILELMKNSDVGINNIFVENRNIHDSDFFPGTMPQELKEKFLKDFKEHEQVLKVNSEHRVMDSQGKYETVAFDFNDESEGTQKLFYLSGPIIDTLREGKLLVIDEIEARMHTLLTRKLVGLFNSAITNPRHAQLVFATHDTNLLSKVFFRRDQIWFIEKDQAEASHLYSLAELKIRNERIFENDYLQGRYGGIPVLGDMRNMVTDQKLDEHAGK